METTRHVVAGSCAIHVAGKLRKVVVDAGWVGCVGWVTHLCSFLLFLWVQVDHIAKYGDDALAMYQRQIADLKTSGPILLNIKQREEMVVRMKSVVRYVMHILCCSAG